MNLRASASLYLDKYRPRQDGKCSVKLCVYHNRRRKYLRTGYHLLEEEFQKILMNKNLGKKNHIKKDLQEIIHKANKTIDSLPFFTFNNFNEIFLDQRKISESVYDHFDIYIEQLKAEKRFKTASSHECSKNKLKSFKSDLCFGDITPNFLNNFEEWMLSKSMSITTIGIYVRNLRTIYNTRGFPPVASPFGSRTGKYRIPAGNNVKKALTIDEIKSVIKHQTKNKTYKDRSIDIFQFLLESGGMNFVDMCKLKWKDITDTHIVFKRKKTLNRTKDNREITLPLTKKSRLIIEKWGTKKEDDNYVFPFFTDVLGEKKKDGRKSSLLKTTNKYLSQISNLEKLDKVITTGFARHTFATLLSNQGMVKDKVAFYMGHKPKDVTENYINRQNNEDDKKVVEIFEDIYEN
ncbi:MAG: tyrosine-type recombinase/integrase [Psychroflexus sp.]